MKLAKLLLVLLAASGASSAADLAVYHQQEEGLYAGASKHYVDRASIRERTVEGTRYLTANVVGVASGRPPSVDQVAVLCDHPQFGLAHTFIRMGKYESGRVVYSGPVTTVTSLASFRPRNIERQPDNSFTKQARLICSSGPRQP